MTSVSTRNGTVRNRLDDCLLRCITICFRLRIDRDPQIHVGPKAKAMLEQGIKLRSKDKIDGRGREIRYTEIDEGLTRHEHNELIKAKNQKDSFQK